MNKNNSKSSTLENNKRTFTFLSFSCLKKIDKEISFDVCKKSGDGRSIFSPPYLISFFLSVMFFNNATGQTGVAAGVINV